MGIGTLLTGTFVLDKRFRLHFTGAPPVRRRGVIAAVAVCQVAEAGVFRQIDRDGPPEGGIMKAHTACLAQALVRELGLQSPAFRALPPHANQARGPPAATSAARPIRNTGCAPPD